MGKQAAKRHTKDARPDAKRLGTTIVEDAEGYRETPTVAVDSRWAAAQAAYAAELAATGDAAAAFAAAQAAYEA